MEIIYYKVIAFVFLFVIVQVILTIIWNISKINSRVNYVDNKLITGVFALATSFIWATVLMAIFESSAYSMDYGTSLSETLSNPPIFGNILQTSLFDFSKMVEVVDANIEISSVEVDLAVLRYFESSGYVDKETMKSILNNYDAYSEDIQKWLSY